MLKKLLQILFVIGLVMLCYYVGIWVLGLLGLNIPHQILIVILVLLGLYGAIQILNGSTPPDILK